jgi:nickel-dependent lactate racemase
MIGFGSNNGIMSHSRIAELCEQAFSAREFEEKRLLFIVPDHTRSAPMDVLFRLIYSLLSERVSRLDFLIALGTHPPMTQAMIYQRMGITAHERALAFPKARFFNHCWNDPGQLAHIGTISAETITGISLGLLNEPVDVTINRMVLDYDVLIILGPVFPHEVVGFSGGNKYLFPGIAGQEIIHLFHWLGALITNIKIIGRKSTAVRRVVDQAAALVPVPRMCLSMVVKDHGLAGLYWGTPEDAWSAAADLSEHVHIVYKQHPYQHVLSCAPAMYHDLWTGGKCMYKVEPVVTDGGKVIIFAPHIKEISPVHGKILTEIGYHTRDFFLKQWDKYKHYPWGVIAHSTHVKGIGTYEKGIEKPRVEVVLATGIPEEMCRRVNLGFLDHRTIRMADFQGREKEGILCVPKAGEILYRR